MARSRLQRAKDWLTVLFLSAGFIYLVLGSANLLSVVLARPLVQGHLAMTQAELATILFGASSIGLVLFSLLLAGAAIIEWQSLKADVKKLTDAAEVTLEKAEEATRSSVNEIGTLRKRLDAELRGRVDAATGFMIGAANSQPDSDGQEEAAKDYLAEAIHHIRRGYDRLKDLDGNGKYMALNNLVYFSCLLGDIANRDELVKYGQDLLQVGRRFRDLPYAAPYLMTYCRVVLVYSAKRSELEQAQAIAKTLLDNGGLTSLQKKEATYLVASLGTRLARAGRPLT
jgi:hypothetical protein